jgi:hypothetical protein
MLLVSWMILVDQGWVLDPGPFSSWTNSFLEWFFFPFVKKN